MVTQDTSRANGEKSSSSETDNLFNMKKHGRHQSSAYIPAQSRFFKDIFEEPEFAQVENTKDSASGFSHQLFPFELLKADGINEEELESPMIPRTGSEAFAQKANPEKDEKI